MDINAKSLMKSFSAAALAVGIAISPVSANAQDVTIRYGTKSNVKKMERYLARAAKKGIVVELESGLGNTECFGLFNEAGKEVVRADAKKARSLVSLARLLEEGEELNRITIAKTRGNCPIDVPSN